MSAAEAITLLERVVFDKNEECLRDMLRNPAEAVRTAMLAAVKAAEEKLPRLGGSGFGSSGGGLCWNTVMSASSCAAVYTQRVLAMALLHHHDLLAGLPGLNQSLGPFGQHVVHVVVQSLLPLLQRL